MTEIIVNKNSSAQAPSNDPDSPLSAYDKLGVVSHPNAERMYTGAV